MRSSTRISQSPGGTSTLQFGDYQLPSSPGRAAPAPPAISSIPENAQMPPAPAQPGPVASPAPAPVGFEQAKLQAIATLSQLSNASPEVEAAVQELLQKLTLVGAKPRAVLSADTAIDTLKATLKLRGTHGIITLGHKFQSMDDSGDNKLSFEEFKKAMDEMDISEPDTHRLFRYFDADCNGYLSFDEFLVGLRGSLTPKRLDMVTKAFKVLDKTGDGQVTLADVTNRYDASKHPDVILGTKTSDQVLAEFLSVFEAQGGGERGDGMITFEEFKKYYGYISASVDLDDYFELLIRNAWHISGGEGWCANTTCKRVLVLHDDGSQSVQEITDDFDVNSSQYLAKLKAQGVAGIKSLALYGSPDDVPEGKGADPKTPAPASVTSPTGRFSASANRKGGADHFRSSITFG